MPRMIDQIRAGGKLAMPNVVWPTFESKWARHTRTVVDMLQDPALPVLMIDNVSDYYYEGSDQEYWSLDKDFPNLAPPYDAFWCEHRMARRIHSADAGDTDLSAMLGPHARIGVLTHALDPHKCGVIGEIPPDIRDRSKWYLWCELFIYYDFGRSRDMGVIAEGTHGAIFCAIDERGALLEKPWMQTYLPDDALGYDKEVARSLMTWLHPMFLAVSFLHCKNVVVQEHAMDAPLRKKFRAKHNNLEPVKWKTLIIEPLKQILRQEGRSREVGLARAMHICRGHFKDYREGRGLFGKYHQLVWQPQLVRGTKGKLGPRDVEVRVPAKP